MLTIGSIRGLLLSKYVLQLLEFRLIYYWLPSLNISNITLSRDPLHQGNIYVCPQNRYSEAQWRSHNIDMSIEIHSLYQNH